MLPDHSEPTDHAGRSEPGETPDGPGDDPEPRVPLRGGDGLRGHQLRPRLQQRHPVGKEDQRQQRQQRRVRAVAGGKEISSWVTSPYPGDF